VCDIITSAVSDMRSVPYISMIKSLWMRSVGHVSCMKKNRIAYMVLVGNLKARNRFEDLCIDRSIILQYLEETGWEGVDLICLVHNRDQ